MQLDGKESRFNYLTKHREEILKRLVSSDKLTKLVNYIGSDCLDKPSLESPIDLLYTRIFPYRFIPEINEETNVYVTMGFGKFQPSQLKAFKATELTIYIMCHQDVIRTDYGLRDDMLLNEIDLLFNDIKGLGIGTAEFIDGDEIMYNSKYSGYWLTYKLTNFN